jgi:hypothetical protein
MSRNDWLINRLMQAADIQKEAGDMGLALLLYDASIALRRMDSKVEQIRDALGVEDE